MDALQRDCGVCLSTALDAISAAPEESIPKDIVSLNYLRMVAAIHIVFFHFWAGSPMGPGAGWGCSWVSCFFLLSGFGPTHSKLSGRARTVRQLFATEGLSVMPQRRVLWRRLVSIWPTFAVSVLLTVMIQCVCFGSSVRVAQMVVELLLLETWMPASWFLSGAYVIPGWFLSALSGCWLLEPAFVKLAFSVFQRGPIAISLMIVAVLAWVLFAPFVKFPWRTFWSDAPFPNGPYWDIQVLSFFALLLCWRHASLLCPLACHLYHCRDDVMRKRKRPAAWYTCQRYSQDAVCLARCVVVTGHLQH